MRRSAKLTLFVMVFLVSCVSPAPEPTVTAVPSSTHTAIPTSRESLEPTTTTPEGDVLFFEADGSEWQANDDQIHHTPGSEDLWIQTEEGLFVFDSETTEWDKVENLAEGSGIYESGGKQFVLMGDQLLWVESVSEEDGETQVVTKDGQKLVWGDGEWEVWHDVVEYPVATDAYKFRECTIEADEATIGDKIAEFVKSLKKYHATDRDYDPEKLVFNKLMRYPRGLIFYDIDAPNYTDPTTRPYERGAFCLIKYTTPEGKVIDYFTSFVQYYQDGLKPNEYPWVPFVQSTAPGFAGLDQNAIRVYMQDMNFPVIVAGIIDQVGFEKGEVDPLTSVTFATHPDMAERFQRAQAGDMTALDGEQGIALQTFIAALRDKDQNPSDWFK